VYSAPDQQCVMAANECTNITIIGSGTIGLSFAALHLTKNSTCRVTVFDTRPDLREYVRSHLPGYLLDVDQEDCMSRLTFADKLEDAATNATIVQEQGPEKQEFKISIWPQIERYAPAQALFWSSTSGIPASIQSQDMRDKTRLIVVHPFNPPHIMPLLEVVPSPQTNKNVVDRTLEYWRGLGRTPVVVKKECTGFVANRLSFALYREACSLVANGVVDVEDLDDIVTASMGPRWAVAGPFKAYHAGGGEGGLTSFMEKIGGTVQQSWEASEKDVKEAEIVVGGPWQADVCRQADEAYGVVDTTERDTKTKKVLEAVGRS
jgi:3-hydroxyacyl-CoA dehydrogenase